MNGGEETLQGLGMQRWNKEPRPERAAASRKQKGIEQDHQEDFRTGVHEANSWIFCQDAGSKGLDIVEGSAPSRMEKATALRVGVENVGEPATPGSFDPPYFLGGGHKIR
jgi:hypothetical protein